ncbi:MAG: hypothetical protein IAE88_17070, partial [Rhodobacteraceae bacterium]|nr:hypothetical protein [Paracoccaceae bacterium]
MTPNKAKPHWARGLGAASSLQSKITGGLYIAKGHKGAIDADDVGAGTKLPFFAAESKVGDSQHRWFVDNYGERCWDLDALSPVVLRQRVETAILGCLDQDAWDHSVDVEKAERESMSGFMDTWKSISGPAKKYS